MIQESPSPLIGHSIQKVICVLLEMKQKSNVVYLPRTRQQREKRALPSNKMILMIHRTMNSLKID
jgi:hypothetical protein